MYVLVNDKSDKVSLCNLSWDHIFILNGVLLRITEEMKSPIINGYLNEILEHIEAAEERILED